MHDAHEFLQTLAIVLSVAAVTTIVFQRLKQPVVFGYLLAGMIVGPHIPIPLVADLEIVRTLAEMGVILLLFALGLEFRLRKLIRVGPTAGVVAVAETGMMAVIGFLLGQLFGWGRIESIYAGAVIAISSTTIIVKAFEEQRVTGKVKEHVLGILIIEDLIAILWLAVLTAVSAGLGVSAGELAATGMRLAVFLAVLIAVGLLVIPRTVRAVVRMRRPETTLVASMGICFAAALAALAFGYSVALGAFIAGSLVAESGEEKVVERLVQPVRDMFAAIFFVSVGVLIDPALIAEHWLPVVVLTIAVIIGKVLAVTVSSFLIGQNPRTSVQAGMSLAQIGEFSFIIAAVGLSSGATRDFLYPVAVAVSAITTLSTPWFIRHSGEAASWVDRKLPRPLQTFVTLYASWIERVRFIRATGGGQGSRLRRLASLVLLDAGLIAAVIIGGALEIERLTAMLGARTGIAPDIARAVIVGVAAAVSVPLLIGLVATARRLGLALAVQALPQSGQGIDLGAAPRRALVVTFQLVIVSVMAIAVLAVTQPFLPTLRSGVLTGILVAVVVALLVGLTIAFWRSATNLHGHTRAGAEIIVAALAQQMATAALANRRWQPGETMERARELLPGLGEPVPLRIPPGSRVAGRTLAEIDLRSLTGATVLAILRQGQPVLMPSGREILAEGDVLAIVGTHDAVEGARALLAAESVPPAPAPTPLPAPTPDA